MLSLYRTLFRRAAIMAAKPTPRSRHKLALTRLEDRDVPAFGVTGVGTYTVNGSPTVNVTTPDAKWAPATGGASWVSANSSGSAANATYTYETSFYLASTAGVSLTGSWAADDTGTVALNSNPGGSAGYGSTSAFSFYGGFNVGMNYLDFTVTNNGTPSTGNPTGLLVNSLSLNVPLSVGLNSSANPLVPGQQVTYTAPTQGGSGNYQYQ